MNPPSFSSFPPSFASFPEQTRSDTQKPDKPANQVVPESEHREKKHKSTKSKRGEKKSHGNLPSEDIHTKVKEEDETHRHVDSVTFFTDRRGDPLNVTYGGLHTHDIPKHHLVGRGTQVLGLSPVWRVLRREGKRIEIGIDDRRSSIKTLTDPSSRRLLAASPKYSLTGNLAYRYEETPDGYLRLPSRRKRTDPESSYRSILPHKTTSDSEPSSDEGHDLSEASDEELPLNTRQSTLQHLEGVVAVNPTSITAWLSLLSHTLSTTPIASKNALVARAEITESVLRRALGAHPANKTSYPLLSRYLIAGEEVWHESKLRSEWTQALAAAPSTDLWLEWLEWRLRVNPQGVMGVVEDGVRCLSEVQDDQSKLRIFWRLAVAFEDAGFIERAIAMFQAQAEMTFGCPAPLASVEFATRLEALEEFWESEEARYGEKGAKGWARSSAQSTGSTNVRSQSLASFVPQNRDQYHLWAEQELNFDKTLRLPTRSTEENPDLDPYSTILFTDIQPFLFPITSREAQDSFRLAWVSFLGIPIPGFHLTNDTENTDGRWTSGHFTRQNYQHVLFPSSNSGIADLAESHAGTLVGKEKHHASPFGPVRSWSLGVVEPLDLCLLERVPRLWYLGQEDATGPDDQMLRNIFSQLRQGHEDYEWDQLFLVYEAVKDLTGALRASRQLLSKVPDSARHWSYHAKIERLRGHDSARKVYEHVLGPSSSCLNDSYIPRLWWDWAELEWLAGQTNTALSIIMRSAGEMGVGNLNMAILRAKRALDERIIDSSFSWKEREAWIKLKALIILLTSSMEDALLVFDACTPQNHVAEESLTVASLTLLFCHTRVLKNPFPLVILRQRAREAYEKFPQNSIILGFFLESEKSQTVLGRARVLFNESDEAPRKGVLRRVQELWLAGWERGGQDIQTERARNTLEAAVLDSRTRLSSTIWQLYVMFEVRCGELQKAKNLIYRAIKVAPLTKSLYLLAFTAVRESFKVSELMSFADSMAERGIRTRKGLDEMEAEDDMDSEMSEDSVEDEIEQAAAETRRLRPYQ